MKKTLTANISGTVFHIEEDAFEKLNRYLDSIRGQFIGSTGQDEIMSDIESRIAELIQERLDGKRQVVSLFDVEHVISIMGQPEDYKDTLEEEPVQQIPPNTGSPNWIHAAPQRKRLFRDPDDKWVGGVLGGIGAYFSIDPLILRILYIVLLLLGVGLFIYLIMWIVVPVASTAGEKLEMRGEPVNVENIKRVFEEGAERVRTGAEQVSKEAREMGRQYAPRAKRGADEFLTFLGDLFRLFFNVIGKIVGLILLLVGAASAVVFITMFFGGLGTASFSDDGIGISSMYDLSQVILGGRGLVELAWLAVIGFTLAPLAGMIHGGISLLFNVDMPKWFGWTLASIWLISVIVLTVVGLRVTADVSQREMVETRHTVITPAENVITLERSQRTASDEKYDRIDPIQFDGETVKLSWARIDVMQSPDSMYHLVVQRRARGATDKEAANRASSMNTFWEQNGDAISISPFFSFSADDLYRGQQIRYVLEVPVGGAVHFANSVNEMLDDVDNVSDTRDRMMVGKTWTMTSTGLFNEDFSSRPSKRSGDKERGDSWKITITERERPDAIVTRTVSIVPDLMGTFFRRL